MWNYRNDKVKNTDKHYANVVLMEWMGIRPS